MNYGSLKPANWPLPQIISTTASTKPNQAIKLPQLQTAEDSSRCSSLLYLLRCPADITKPDPTHQSAGHGNGNGNGNGNRRNESGKNKSSGNGYVTITPTATALSAPAAVPDQASSEGHLDATAVSEIAATAWKGCAAALSVRRCMKRRQVPLDCCQASAATPLTPLARCRTVPD